MGVDCRTYLIYGVDITYDVYKKFDEEYELYDSNNIVVDGMCGNYCYYGEILGTVSEDDSSTIIVDNNLEELYDKIKDELMDQFGISDEPKLILFNHYY